MGEFGLVSIFAFVECRHFLTLGRNSPFSIAPAGL
jgi:hypothetical protein